MVRKRSQTSHGRLQGHPDAQDDECLPEPPQRTSDTSRNHPNEGRSTVGRAKGSANYCPSGPDVRQITEDQLQRLPERPDRIPQTCQWKGQRSTVRQSGSTRSSVVTIRKTSYQHYYHGVLSVPPVNWRPPGRMLEKLRSFVARGHATETLRECRDCGTGVDHTERCPNCDSTNIVRYEID